LSVKFRARGADGRVAIYRGPDDAPFTSPLGNLPRVLFHSDLHYPTIIGQVSGSITFPARGANLLTTATQVLFAHGRPGFPMILGQFNNLDGQVVTLAGSVPVQMNAFGFARWATLGADAANVIMHEQVVTHVDGGFAAITLSYTVYILDVLL
jgi:hypothetical protein